MKNEKLLYVIGKVNDDIIQETAPKIRRRGKIKWINWGTAAAACLILVLAVSAIGLLQKGIDSAEGPVSLTVLPVTEETGGMGFEAYLAYDISQLDNGNPWREEENPDTLPAYRNTAYSDPAGQPVSRSGAERLLKYAEQAAAALNMKVRDVSYQTAENSEAVQDAGDNIISGIAVETDSAVIQVDGKCTVTVWFNDSIMLPGEYSFTGTNVSDSEADNVIQYLAAYFSALISFDSPRRALSDNYSYDGLLSRSYYAYDKSGDMKQKILNYNFSLVQFAPDDNGGLRFIRMDHILSSADKLGDYPVISSDAALKLLLDGYYITTVPEALPGEEYVAKTELVYRTDNTNEVFMPYYRFLIELPDGEGENGLKHYGAYYVPAVERQYISGMPVQNDGFDY